MTQRRLELFKQRLACGQVPQLGFCLLIPPHTAVLLAASADASDPREVEPRVGDAAEDEVDGFEPHGYGGVDLSELAIDEDALFDSILGAEVGVEVYLCGGDYLEVRIYGDGCGRCMYVLVAPR